MNTVDFLQLWLSAQRERVESITYIEPTPHLTLMSGASISVQAGEQLYCTPKAAIGPYTSVEVLAKRNPDYLFLAGLNSESFNSWNEFVYGSDYKEYLIAGQPFSNVDIDKLAGLIDYHGGVDVKATLQTIKDIMKL